MATSAARPTNSRRRSTRSRSAWTGRLALDVGASTGGFTQVLLERGARRVIALDVGHGQLAAPVREDPRVTTVEGVNARSLTARELAELSGTEELPALVVADVSFISLTTILPALVETCGPDADYVLLIKPQFEVGRQGIREGLVRDRARRQDAAIGGALGGVGPGAADGGHHLLPIAGKQRESGVPGLAEPRRRRQSDRMVGGGRRTALNAAAPLRRLDGRIRACLSIRRAPPSGRRSHRPRRLAAGRSAGVPPADRGRTGPRRVGRRARRSARGGSRPGALAPAGRGCRDLRARTGDRAGGRRHDPARGRVGARNPRRRCSASTSATSAFSPRPSATTWPLRSRARWPATTRSKSA